MEFKYVDCPTNELEIKNLVGMILHKSYLIIHQQRFLSVWDTKDIRNLQKVAEFPFPTFRNNMRLFGDELYVWGKRTREKEEHIHILDVSDPLHITQKQEIVVQDEGVEINGLYLSNGKIYAAGRKGGIMEILPTGEVNTLLAWKDSINDIVVHESLLITKGGSRGFDGVRLFELKKDELTEIKDIPTQFVIPSNIEWWIEGESVLILGGKDENVLKIDVSNPATAKRVKSAKTGVGLGKQFVREGDRIYVLGKAIESRDHAPAVCVIDASGEIPELKYKQVIKEYKSKDGCSDSSRGIIKIDNYLLLATYACWLGVVEIV